MIKVATQRIATRIASPPPSIAGVAAPWGRSVGGAGRRRAMKGTHRDWRATRARKINTRQATRKPSDPTKIRFQPDLASGAEGSVDRTGASSAVGGWLVDMVAPFSSRTAIAYYMLNKTRYIQRNGSIVLHDGARRQLHYSKQAADAGTGSFDAAGNR